MTLGPVSSWFKSNPKIPCRSPYFCKKVGVCLCIVDETTPYPTIAASLRELPSPQVLESLRTMATASGETAYEMADAMRAAQRGPTPEEQALGRFRVRHSGDPRPFGKWEPEKDRAENG